MSDGAEQSPAGTQMPGIVVSYRELVEIRTQQATMLGMLQAALALTGRVDNLDKRVGVVENKLSGEAGEKRTWVTIAAFAFGVVSMALGGGATMYLPKLWAHLR